jgi:hypothetical protein
VDARNVGRPEEIVCDDILVRHSDYLEGSLAPHDAARIQWHLATCSSCARYDRIVRRGLELVRGLPEVEPSEDFQDRLQHRLFHVQDAAAISEPRAAGGAAALAVAGMIALLAWSPLLFNERESAALADAGAQAGAAAGPALELLPVSPLDGLGDPWFPAARLSPLAGGDAVMTLVSFPGPHSPLRVEPPVHGRAFRTISSEYRPVD